VLRASYSGHYRRMLPRLLEALEFRSNNAAHQPVVDALALLARYAGRPGAQRFYDRAERVPLERVVPAGWWDAVVDEHGKVERIPYELCVLKALREGLRRREVWVVGATRWRNPDEDLPQDFDANRDVHYAALRQPRDPSAFIAALQERMRRALGQLDEALAAGSAGGVRITSRAGQPWITVPKLAPQPEPSTLAALKDEVARRWGVVDLLDILKEADFLCGLTGEFASVATGRRSRPRCCSAGCCWCCLRWVPTWASASSPAASTAVRMARPRRRCGTSAGCSSTATTCAARSSGWSCHPGSPRPDPVGSGHRLRQRLQEVRRLAVQPAHRVARPLPRRRRDDLLARGAPLGRHLQPAHVLLGLRGRRDDPGGAAPPDERGDRPQLRRHPRRWCYMDTSCPTCPTGTRIRPVEAGMGVPDEEVSVRVRQQRGEDGSHRVELLDEAGEPIEVVSGFLRFLAARDFSPNTLASYAYDLRHLWRFLNRDGLTWEEFAPRHAIALLEYLRSVPSRRPRRRMTLTVATIDAAGPATKLAAATVNRILAAVSSFYEYVIMAGLFDRLNPIEKRPDPALQRVSERHRPFMGAATGRARAG
jgi:hypothetical protein